MLASKPRGSRIVYVAPSARELPDEVQQWLGQSDHRAASSPNIYDALARLASGARPAILIVSASAVDWNEMEFFDRAARLSRETVIYVVGQDHDAAKIDAACKRGARRFQPEALDEDLATPVWSRSLGVNDILAASLKAQPALKPAPAPAPFRSVPRTPEEPETAEDETPETPRGELPPVRLVNPASDTDNEAASGEEAEHPDAPIPFPWSPHPNRPQRTPPKPTVADALAADPPTPAAAPASRQPAELSADELAALMGRPVSKPDAPAKEGTG